MILVSVCMITYNHEDYIAQAIESVLMQKTTFPIELVIGEDCSTDSTAAIVKEYSHNYPEIIKARCNLQNLGMRLNGNKTRQECSGKYIAICEGDDYWTDPYKLQKQVDELKNHPECYLCFHPAIVETNFKKVKIRSNHSNLNRIFNISEVILGGGYFMPTESLVLNRKVIENLPEWFLEAPVGDYFLQILGSMNGGALYLNEPMSVHRTNLRGNWTDRNRNEKSYLDWYLRIINTIDQVNLFTNKIYENEFNTVKKELHFNTLKNRIISIKTRRNIYNNNSKIFKLKEKILWKLVYSNLKINNLLVNLRDFAFNCTKK